ncbi:MAG: toxin-antitoxin system YwqK family antitoxin [Cetobacterium sp.]|uniref:toxin-antitoxin system YwqK family antitoxin n=1 Tax=Cetobacterium sp. TaxID=2071632 RepID=UPI003F3A927C
MKKYLILLLVLFLVSACDKNELVEKNGVFYFSTESKPLTMNNYTTKHKNGEVKTKANYRDGIIVGGMYHYSENGKLEFYTKYDRNVITSKLDFINKTYTEFYKNGKVKIETGYQLPYGDTNISKYYYNGAYKEYDEDGSLVKEAYNKNGKYEGLYKKYYKNGQVMLEGSCVQGELEGIIKEYYEDRKLKLEVNLNNGLYHGTSKEYDSNGKLKELSTYENGHIRKSIDYTNNIYREYVEIKSLKIEAQYKNNKFDGYYKEFYDRFSLKIETNYKNGELDGLYREFYESGELKIESTYKNGKLDGVYKEFYDDRQDYTIRGHYGNTSPIKIERNYKNGINHGSHKEYEKNGKIKSYDNYKDGKKVNIFGF